MLCPFEDRYGSREMREVFSKENIVRTMIEVLKAELLALIELGILGEDAYHEIMSLDLESIGGIDRIKVLERELGHEVLAIVYAVAEGLGEHGNLVHLGLSSPDIIDSCWSLLIRKGISIIERKLSKAIKVLVSLSERYSKTLVLGKTHKFPALPVPFEFILIGYAYRLSHVLNLLEKYRRWRCYGKMSGPTGAYPLLGRFQADLEKRALMKIGLRPIDISFQWLPREFLSEILFFLSLLCAILAKISRDLWEMSSPGNNEILFPKNPSSSSMPHKTSPLKIERIIGISRSIRSLLPPFLENIEEEGLGDSTKSSVERISIPHAFLMADQALEDFLWILENLKVDEERAKERVLSEGRFGLFCSNLMTSLCLKGMNRKEAYELVHSLSTNAKDLEDLVERSKRDPFIRKFLSDEEIEKCKELDSVIEGAKSVVERAKKKIKIILDSLAL